MSSRKNQLRVPAAKNLLRVSAPKDLLRVSAAVALAILLSGCVVVPVGPGYPHHHYWY
jgi:hypothetical protein